SAPRRLRPVEKRVERLPDALEQKSDEERPGSKIEQRAWDRVRSHLLRAETAVRPSRRPTQEADKDALQALEEPQTAGQRVRRPHLTDADLGLGYNLDRIEKVSVPGKVDPDVSLGLLYQPPRYSGDERLFRDLLSYAPGLNTREADVQA